MPAERLDNIVDDSVRCIEAQARHHGGGAAAVLVILLAALGVPLWLALGVLGAGLWSRRSFRSVPGVFAVKCREIDESATATKWPRRAVYARWVHDVLIVHQGVALVRNRALAVASMAPATIPSGEVRGLGDDPVSVRIRLDRGQLIDVAAGSADRDALIGPFDELHAAAGGDRRP